MLSRGHDLINYAALLGFPASEVAFTNLVSRLDNNSDVILNLMYLPEDVYTFHVYVSITYAVHQNPFHMVYC